jgi:RNA polymerase sigma-70 factor (ECF subfamily)
VTALPQQRPHRRPDLDFVSFYRENFDPVCWYLRLRCSSREVADEAAQEAFFMAFVRWPEVSQHEKPVAWVYKTGDFKLREALRKERALRMERGRHCQVPLDEALAEHAAEDPHPRTDVTRVLVDLMNKVNPDERQALFLYSFGWSDKEGASIMNVTLSTFKNLKRNGIRKLRSHGACFAVGEGEPR